MGLNPEKSDFRIQSYLPQIAVATTSMYIGLIGYQALF